MNNTKKFADLGLSVDLLRHLTNIGFENATPIQSQAIPAGLEGKDIIGIAETGTGKTFAFLIPILEQIKISKKKAVVLAPTRELAEQIQQEFRKIAQSFNIDSVLIIGGASMDTQCKILRKNPSVIIATPGRLIDHLKQCTIKLDTVGHVVLDEADRMLDMGFKPQIEEVLKSVKKDRQTMLFSATMPEEIKQLIHRYMNSPITVEISRAGTTNAKVDHDIYNVQQDKKPHLLEVLMAETTGPVLVFTRTKHGAKKLADIIRGMGYAADEIHSNRTQAQRKRALAGFKSGQYRVLVATDIAARGIDVKDIQLVVNYDLPEHPDDYVHRIGRTGRGGKSGKATSFVTGRQKFELKRIERHIKQTIPSKQMPQLPEMFTTGKQPRFSEQSSGFGGGRDRSPRQSSRGGFGRPRTGGFGGGRSRFGGEKREGSRDFSEKRSFGRSSESSRTEKTEGAFRSEGGRKPFRKFGERSADGRSSFGGRKPFRKFGERKSEGEFTSSSDRKPRYDRNKTGFKSRSGGSSNRFGSRSGGQKRFGQGGFTRKRSSERA
jgi:ATP-dependent RNA helicase RhlE